MPQQKDISKGIDSYPDLGYFTNDPRPGPSRRFLFLGPEDEPDEADQETYTEEETQTLESELDKFAEEVLPPEERK